MKPPVACVRAHLPQSDPRCDTVTVLNMAARRRKGRRYADMNAIAGLDEDWNLHWPEGPELNHFTHRVNPVTGHLERMPEHLRHKPVLETPRAEIRLWRKKVGRRWQRPFTVAQRQAQARRRFVYVTWELKSRSYSLAGVAARFVASVGRAGGSWCVMTLVTMALWGEKLTAFHNAGAGTALLAHGAVRPPNLHEFSPAYIDRIWGHFT